MGAGNHDVKSVGVEDILVKTGHSKIIHINESIPGDSTWEVINGIAVRAAATGTVTVCSVTGEADATGTVTMSTVLEELTATGTVTIACALEEATATGTVTLCSATGEVHASGAITMVCPTVCGTACGTITLACVAVGRTVNVNGRIYTAVCGTKADHTEFDIAGTNCVDAVDLLDSLNNDTRCPTCTCGTTNTICAAVITVTSVVTAATANSIVLTSSCNCDIAISACGFTGGKDADTLTVNCLVYTAVAQAKADDREFDVSSACNNTIATDLADSIDDDVRCGGLDDLTATACCAVVTAVSTVGGTGGNAITISDTAAGRITSGATFGCGIDGDFVTLNCLVYTAVVGTKDCTDTQFSIDTSDCLGATDLAATITADTRLGLLGDLTGGACAAVVTLTSVLSGSNYNNIPLVTSCAASLAVSCCTMLCGVTADNVTLNGLTYTATCATCPCCGTFDVVGETNCAAATNLATAITCDCRAGTLQDLTASACGAVVTLTPTSPGVAANAITLATSDTCTLSISCCTLTCGNDACTVTVNGLTYTAVCGAGCTCCGCFSTDCSNCATATDLATRINCDCRTGTLNDVTACACCAVVTVTQTVGGTGGNATTFVSSCACTLAITGSGFLTCGTTGDVLTVNGLDYTGVVGAKADDTEFSIDCSDCAAATDLALSITCDCRTPVTEPCFDQTASATNEVVTITADVGATGNNICLITACATSLAISGPFLTGGTGELLFTITQNVGSRAELRCLYKVTRDGIFINNTAGATGELLVTFD